MKQISTISALLLISILSASAQTGITINNGSQKEKNDTLIITHTHALQLQQVLGFSYQWLPKSDAPAKDVGLITPLIQDIYNDL